jgi:hypothetical protein
MQATKIVFPAETKGGWQDRSAQPDTGFASYFFLHLVAITRDVNPLR